MLKRTQDSAGLALVKFLFFVFCFCFCFLRFYLFIHERHREKQRHRQREKQAPGREPDAGLDPGSPGSDPGLKAVLTHRATWAAQKQWFLDRESTPHEDAKKIIMKTKI